MIAPAKNRGDGGGREEQGELFERQFKATFPSPNSQAGIALRDLIQGKRLRQSEWLHVGWRLAAAVKELDYCGWPVMSWPVEVPGRERPIAEYSLPGWVLREVGGQVHE